MHAGFFVLAVTQWQLEGGTNKNSSRCLHSPPLSFHLVLSNFCCPLHLSSFIPDCWNPSFSLHCYFSPRTRLPWHQADHINRHPLTALILTGSLANHFNDRWCDQTAQMTAMAKHKILETCFWRNSTSDFKSKGRTRWQRALLSENDMKKAFWWFLASN